MRDTPRRGWQRWRVARVEQPMAGPTPDRFSRPPAAGNTDLAPVNDHPALTGPPSPDGIRHELVARVRREIEAGTYDTEARWHAAEERLLRRIDEGI
jgi:hypothetical protein